MSSFFAEVFGGKSPRALAVAVTRTFLQGFLGALVAVPLVLDVHIEPWQAACVGGINAVIALVHGLVQAPAPKEATTTTTVETTTPATVTVAPDPPQA